MENNKISRLKIELFIDCPRHFGLEVKYNLEGPKDFAGGWIGQKYNPIIKNEFDTHRQNSTKPEKLKELGLDLFNDLERLKIWQGKGIEFYYQKQHPPLPNPT